MNSTQLPQCKNLVLDAGPLLSLSPLRGLAETYYTVPQVLAELKDRRAREHFERLGLTSGVKVEIKSPDAASLATVIQWAKKTGDYAVLSHPDLCVLALTYSLHEQYDKQSNENVNTSQPESSTSTAVESDQTESESVKSTSEVSDEELPLEEQLEDSTGPVDDTQSAEGEDLEPLDVELRPIEDNVQPSHSNRPSEPDTEQSSPVSAPLYDDPSDSDDGEGEWITPANAAFHTSRALDLLPSVDSDKKRKGKGVEERIFAGCMTADFAMQNVLLQMGLNLVGTEGKRIQKVKSWVLRCHACYKICKDATKKFCPSCGNPTLLRASVTIASPNASADAPAMQVHLKPNFQYKIRGTKYSIPSPKPGSAKKGPGEGLILREDQLEYMRAKKKADGKREREEAKLTKGILARGAEGNMGSAGVGSWMDPDWMPEMISVGTGGKGRTMRSAGMDGDMPAIGYGRKNPNERKKRK